MIARYPGHPDAAEAYRWLIRDSSSSEARHRHDLGQFMIVDHASVKQPETQPGEAAPNVKLNAQMQPQTVGGVQKEGVYSPLLNPDELRQWHQAAIKFEERL